MRLLLVEDDPLLQSSLRQSLEQAGFAVDASDSAGTAAQLGLQESYRVAVVDIGLPDGNGLEVMQQWRQAGCEMPVLLLTARDSWQDKVNGLKAGADDYLAKPFHWEELLARLHALIRRSEGRTSSTIEVGRYRLDEERQRVCTPNGLFSKEELLEQLYNLEAEPSLNTIEAYIRRLRLLIGRNAIQTQRGQGYVFTAQE